MLLIKEAVLQSRLIAQAGAFFKVTGRYPIYNLAHFLKRAENAVCQKKKLYCDVKDHPLYDWLKTGWCGHSFECRLFATTKDYYLAKMAPLADLCNDYTGHLMERVLFDFVKREVGQSKMSLRFDREPHFGGVEGSEIHAFSFTKNQGSFKGKIKRLVGNAIRLFVPCLKF